MKVALPLAKTVMATLGIIASASAIDGAIKRKIRGRNVVRAGKWINLVILNEAIDDIISIIKSPKNSEVLTDRENETLKHKIKETRRWIS